MEDTIMKNAADAAKAQKGNKTNRRKGTRRAGGSFLDAIRAITARKGCRELGEYRCRGFDTFGPFRLIGGIAKGHPTAEELAGAAAFYRSLPPEGDAHAL